MVRLDSTKLKIPMGWFGLNVDDCTRVDVTQPISRDALIPEKSPLTTTNYHIPKPNLSKGIKSVIAGDTGLTIELSAKVLRANYFDGININNIEQIWKTLRGIDQLSLDERSIEQTSILRCDSTHTLPIEDTQSISSILSALSVVPTNIRYSTKDHKGESLIFQNKGSSKRERLILYDKLIELRKDKDVNFVSEVFTKVVSNSGYLRVETNISKFVDLKELFKVPSTPYSGIKLLDALGSQENPTLKVYDKIMNANIPIEETQLEFFFNRDEIQYFKTISAHQFIKSVGMESILIAFNWDIRKIRIYLLDVLEYKKSRVSQLIKEFELEKLRLENKGKENPTYLFEVVDQIRELLKVA
jgi:hypothetical protein